MTTNTMDNNNIYVFAKISLLLMIFPQNVKNALWNFIF